MTPSIEEVLQRQDRELAEIKQQVSDHAQQLEAGNKIILGLDAKLTLLNKATQPVVEAMQTMQTGIRIIGAIGRVSERVARWSWTLMKFGGVLIGVYVFARSVLLGHPLAEAWADLWKLIR